MTQEIRIGIIGYGNIGRAVEMAVKQNPDTVCAGIYTRREPSKLETYYPETLVFPLEEAQKHAGGIDVAILCGGSATDLPEQGPRLAALFNTVDSFDTHARIPEYYAAVDRAAREAGTTAVISTGWDPGLFSLMRVIEDSVLPVGESYTFWGPGVSQGHSDAIRRVEGVTDARQYTIPVDKAVDAVRRGEAPKFTSREKHFRDCYVVAEEGADLDRIEKEITSMPYYFSDYDTRVTFISRDEMREKHATMPHGGFVMRTGADDAGNRSIIEFSLKLASNPGFTATVLVAYARAAWRLNGEGKTGALTVFDIAPAYLSARTREELIKNEL
ncbi:MAG: diaminopimelate dehydrogenase [Deltaproteobacteria bacterium]|nr:diaminopimelate dehydrogenase [Deltaproteobacteria bacterium]